MRTDYPTIRVKLDEGAYLPERAHDTDAGADIRCRESFTIPAHGFMTIDTGVHVEIPEGYAGFIKSKSGLNMKHDINSEGVIDTGYTGAIIVKLYNHGDTDFAIRRGDKLTQLVLLPIGLPELEQCDSLDETERGDGGFGSTGR
jgi:dUTP pyrophosphatase